LAANRLSGVIQQQQQQQQQQLHHIAPTTSLDDGTASPAIQIPVPSSALGCAATAMIELGSHHDFTAPVSPNFSTMKAALRSSPLSQSPATPRGAAPERT
jgi:hypothetical protein